MSLWVLDTDTISLFFRGQAAVEERVEGTDPGDLCLTIVNVEEILSGWYAEIRRTKNDAQLVRVYRSLQQAVEFVGQTRILPLDDASPGVFHTLRRTHRRVGTNDLRIAAIALSNRAALATCNLRDFRPIDGLKVEDWSQLPG